MFKVSVNNNPVEAIPINTVYGVESTNLIYTITDEAFTDADGHDMTFEAVEQGALILPAWLTFEQDIKTFHGTPTVVANTIIDLTITDSIGASIQTTFTINISADDAPTVAVGETMSDKTIYNMKPFSFEIPNILFTDINQESLIISIE